VKKLSELNIGTKAVIQSVTEDETSLKLMEMGCVPGEEVCILRKAPMGDPIAISVAGYVLSLRKEEARFVMVKTFSPVAK